MGLPFFSHDDSAQFPVLQDSGKKCCHVACLVTFMKIGGEGHHILIDELLLDLHKQIVGGGIVEVEGATINFCLLAQLLDGYFINVLVLQNIQ